MLDPGVLMEKAKYSGFYLKLLNTGLARMIPFNKPHGFRIIDIGDYHIKTFLPYKKPNLNHIKGLHACALATLSEFTTGPLLLAAMHARQYRLILAKLEIQYEYQGKTHAYANFSVSEHWIEEKIRQPIIEHGKAVVPCEIEITDKSGNSLCTAIVTWQLKPWSAVKTQLN